MIQENNHLLNQIEDIIDTKLEELKEYNQEPSAKDLQFDMLKADISQEVSMQLSQHNIDIYEQLLQYKNTINQLISNNNQDTRNQYIESLY